MKRYFLNALYLLCITAGVAAAAPLVTILQEGAFDATVRGQVNSNFSDLAGRSRVDITICGDGTTINNNTIYYGPSMVAVANAGRTCDVTQAGSATEATADEAALDSTAIYVVGMDCFTQDPGASGVSFTLRSAAAAVTPALSCSVANAKLGCTADVQTTATIASGATMAIAAASAGNQGTTQFFCTIHAYY